jgi:hypothetical protein
MLRELRKEAEAASGRHATKRTALAVQGGRGASSERGTRASSAWGSSVRESPLAADARRITPVKGFKEASGASSHLTFHAAFGTVSRQQQMDCERPNEAGSRR